MVRTVLTQLATLAALAAAVALTSDLDALKTSPWKMTLFVGSVVIACIAAGWEVWGTWRARPIEYRGKRRQKKILRYMTELLGTDGQCVMSSNDLSWVKGDARDALFEKARNKSLVLVMPRANDLSAELHSAGASVHYYGDDDFKFASRFTLVNNDRADKWVAIGHGTSRVHTILEAHAKDDDPAVHLASDLIRLARRVSASGSTIG